MVGWLICLLLTTFVNSLPYSSANGLMVMTVATNRTDGFVRYMRSAEHFGLEVEVLGMGVAWEGGDMNYRGGGHKVNLLKKALKPYKNDNQRLVLFTDSFDVIFMGGAEEIAARFAEMDSRLVFSSESLCWPEEELAEQYPQVEDGYKYLNSGGFIGYASDIYEILKLHKIKNNDDDQLFYTKIYLNKALREEHKIKLDHKALIFQNIYAAEKDVKLVTDGTDERGSYIVNEATATRPLILHGNGKSKLLLNSIGNYVGGGYDDTRGCTSCKKHEQGAADGKTVLMTIVVSRDSPFLEEFFEGVALLAHPADRLHLFIYNKVKFHEPIVQAFVKKNSKKYSSVKQILPDDNLDEDSAQDIMMEYCLKKECDYLFVLYSLAMLERPDTISRLIQQDKSVIAPLLTRYNEAFSNFWGALNTDGFYARSFDYMDIVNNRKRGVWNVPYISVCYLVKSSQLSFLSGAYKSDKYDPDMAFSSSLREKGVHMYVDNTVDYGYMTNPDSYDTKLLNADFYQVIDNQHQWERRYLHENYSQALQPGSTIQQPCPDVYWFPITTARFCNELIGIMENFGKWSSGTNTDERLAGGYENVPTRDIHMNQVGLEKQWLHILGEYVRPLQEHVFTGYFHDPPRSLMNFVVRYRPDEQPSLRPHHDSSTYTINIALNRPGLDYEGGGCHFLRYNCSVTNTKMGWMLMHPGRLTHFHEGLRVTKGTRYIMISFVDP
ncbi:procollagen-lysine,2-oxoglutarate 5-dioxygenase 3 [Cimex lectularius]|uniref:Fe2OG dioxygenase domain-containing protein n=1 Tax=Cimex lectularius TaxID=79782 RepID=A0A8I6S3P9_CIMLE|nr:procollagen-lysine,2-oxoglutarate 5-dioxygenase 3 [Cimex lectularius]